MDSDQMTSGMMANAAVDRFFRRVLADPSLAPKFDGAELHRLAAQQRSFLVAALGGLAATAKAVDAGPGTESALATHLGAALQEVGVPTERVSAITAAAQQTTAPAGSAPLGHLATAPMAFTLPEVPSPQPAPAGKSWVAA